jgi:hypothetical protein
MNLIESDEAGLSHEFEGELQRVLRELGSEKIV